MEFLGNFLNKYRNLVPYGDDQKSALCEILKEVIGVEIEKYQIGWISRSVNLKVSTKIKEAVMINKPLILQKLTERLGPKSPLDIR